MIGRIGSLLFLLLFTVEAIAQERGDFIVSGTVFNQQDSSALDYAMVVIQDTTEQGAFDFAQTDADGFFALRVSATGRYVLEVSYLGYASQKVQLGQISADQTLDVFLQPLDNDLQEIVVRDTLPPISYRPDTVIYNAKAFYTGDQRKLGALIDRMPGLSVDDEHNITYRGKPVKTLLVEDKPFFGGGTELALTGLPADAIGRIEVLEDYSAMGFKLNPYAEKKLALNVRLREEKKNVYFGDVQAGGGVPGVYQGRTNTFRYSTRNSLYGILAANNVNQELLSLKQVMRLMSGQLSINGQDFAELYETSQLARPSRYANEGSAGLGAVGTDFVVLKNTDVHGQVVATNRSSMGTTLRNTRFGVDGSNPLREIYFEKRQNSNEALVAQLSAKPALKGQRVLALHTRYAHNADDQESDQDYRSNFGDRTALSLQNGKSDRFSASMEYIQKFSGGHSQVVEAGYDYRRARNGLDLMSSDPFLSTVRENRATPCALEQTFTSGRDRAQLAYVYMRRISRKWFLKSSSEIRQDRDKFSLKGADAYGEQDLTTGLQRSEISALLRLREWKLSGEIEGARITYAYAEQARRSDIYYLPGFSVKRTLGRLGEVSIAYADRVKQPETDWFWLGRRVLSFNTLRIGSPRLSPWKTSDVSLNVNGSNMLSGLNWMLTATHSFSTQLRPFSRVAIAGNERSLIYEAAAGRGEWTNALLRIEKEFKAGKLTNTLFFNRSAEPSLVDELQVDASLSYLRWGSALKYYLGKRSDLTIGTQLSHYDYRAGPRINQTYNLSGEIALEHNWKNFKLEAELEGDAFDVSGDDSYLLRARLNLFHQIRDTPWSVSASAYSPLGQKSVLEVTQEELFFSSSRYEIFRPYAILGLGYDF